MIFAAALGSGSLPSRRIYTVIDIDVPPRQACNILADNGRYAEWNPYHVRVDGELETGEPLSLENHRPNGDRIEIEPHVPCIDPLRELTWAEGFAVFFTANTCSSLRRWVRARSDWCTASPLAASRSRSHRLTRSKTDTGK